MKTYSFGKIMVTSVICGALAFGSPTLISAADTSTSTEAVSVEDLQKQIEELQAQVETLTQENEELKTQLAESDTTETISLPEEVANADTTTQYNDVTTVQLVQNVLNAAGFNCGSADGKIGQNTSAQISAYETANGLVVNGAITDQLIASLGLTDKIEDNAKKEAAKASYSSDYTYDQLARTPDSYTGQKVRFKGKVLQTGESWTGKYMRLALNSDYDTVAFVNYASDAVEFNLLEDDIVTIYGVANGTYTYESVMGQSITLPQIDADIVELNQ